MSYYGARVTTYKKAHKGKVTVHSNLFAVGRTVASNKEAEEWKTTAVTHRDISVTAEETPQSSFSNLKITCCDPCLNFQILCMTNLGGKLSCNRRSCASWLHPLLFTSMTKPGENLFPFHFICHMNFYDINASPGYFHPNSLQVFIPCHKWHRKTEYEKDLQQALQLTCHTTDMPCPTVYFMNTLQSTAA